MAKSFELGSKEYALPQQTNEHYSEDEFTQKQDMYDAIEYESGIEPDQYQSKKEITDEAKALIELRKAREKADKKRGAGILNFLHSLAA